MTDPNLIITNGGFKNALVKLSHEQAEHDQRLSRLENQISEGFSSINDSLRTIQTIKNWTTGAAAGVGTAIVYALLSLFQGGGHLL
ncbi:hypothetical protein [Aristophania vespae]|uniref:hypothetical protein n=1 Tax=Aristophania vespae TaxID=2697033 RepID=UPI002351B310|nr:hypothetical protein [Aristophania vespae]UMM63914.1 hypothetical protein DM15PD_08940 [Aristophania vespae]